MPGIHKILTLNANCGPNERDNIIKIIFVTVFIIIITVLLVFSSFRTAGKSRSLYSIYIKIMTTHF